MTIGGTFEARSWLFVPGDNPAKMAKAVAGEADVVLIDLEDAVAEPAKAAARGTVRDFLAGQHERRERLWVRINPLDGPHTLADLAAIMPARPAGIMLPKVDGRADAERVHHYLSAFEAANGIEEGTTKLIVLVTETAAAMFTTGDYRGVPRIVALTWGGEDLAAALGASGSKRPDGQYTPTFELARSLCLLGAAAAGVAPIETVSSDFRDLDALKARAEQVRRDGYRGMLAIHPAQVAVINAAFSPSEAEIAEAREIVAIFAANPGVGAIGYKGGMLDLPFLTRAEALLARVAKG